MSAAPPRTPHMAANAESAGTPATFGAPMTRSHAASAVLHIWQSWRSLTRVEAGGFLTLGLLFGLISMSLLDAKAVTPVWPMAWRLLLTPAICMAVLLLSWAPADRSDPDHPARTTRLVAACVLGSMVAVPVIWGLAKWFGWPTWESLCHPKCPPPLPVWQQFAGDFLSVLLPGGLAWSVLEMMRRRWRSAEQLQVLLAEQTALGRQAMAARLATMQAQVEPQFLFDVLVDVQAQYARDGGAEAAAQLERLIHHLRVALPRLRDHNTTTLDAESALLASYLALRQGLQRQPVQFVDALPASVRGIRIPAMLLLPLLQRALRLGPDRLPSHVHLDARLGAARLALGMRVSQPGLCGDDDDLAAQRNRLRVLAGDSATLQCLSDATSTTFTIELPA